MACQFTLHPRSDHSTNRTSSIDSGFEFAVNCRWPLFLLAISSSINRRAKFVDASATPGFFGATEQPPPQEVIEVSHDELVDGAEADADRH